MDKTAGGLRYATNIDKAAGGLRYATLTGLPEASGMRHWQSRRRPPVCDTQRDFPQVFLLVEVNTGLWKTFLPSEAHAFIYSSLNPPIDACKRRPRARNTGRRSIAAGVFNPPPRNEVTEQSVLDLAQGSQRRSTGKRPRYTSEDPSELPFGSFGPNFG